MSESRQKVSLVLIFFLLILMGGYIFSQTAERFPKPDFQSAYQRPSIKTIEAEAGILIYLDLAVLILSLSLASYFALKLRSRRKIFILMIFSLLYFGFYRTGCVCAVGSLQNISYALFNPGYLIPLTVILFFILPLVFSLFFGRTFCAAVCPLGAIQDLVVIKPVKIPSWLSEVLSIIPYLYLGLAVLFAATGTGFIICQYDPFVGFFRFGANFYMLVLGVSFLLLGTIVARPYCRFFCPYGVLLNWMSRLSKRHVKITPDECNNCRLCEESCPVGAIKTPQESLQPAKKEYEIKRLTRLFILIPVIVVVSGWAGSRISKELSKQHYTVSLAEEIIKENISLELKPQDDVDDTAEKTRAFRATGKPEAELFANAQTLRSKFETGGWIIGGFLGFIIIFKLTKLSLQQKEPEYYIDTGNCISCGRCFKHCPYELVRLGIIKPDDIDNYISDKKEIRERGEEKENGNP